jgi:hypothetical protein
MPCISLPAPTLTSVTPNTVAEGSSNTTLTITGSGFAPGTSIHFGTVNLPATLVSSTQLTVNVPLSLLVSPYDTTVAVSNPAPGGGVSSTLPFTITSAPTTVTLVSSPAPAITVSGKKMTVLVTLQNTGNFDALNLQVSSAQLNGTANTGLNPSSVFNTLKGRVSHLTLVFPSSAASSGTTPTLTLNYTSANAGSGTLTVTCGPVP